MNRYIDKNTLDKCKLELLNQLKFGKQPRILGKIDLKTGKYIFKTKWYYISLVRNWIKLITFKL